MLLKRWYRFVYLSYLEQKDALILINLNDSNP